MDEIKAYLDALRKPQPELSGDSGVDQIKAQERSGLDKAGLYDRAAGSTGQGMLPYVLMALGIPQPHVSDLSDVKPSTNIEDRRKLTKQDLKSYGLRQLWGSAP